MKFKISSDFVGGQTEEIDLLDSVFCSKVSESSIYELIKNQNIKKRQCNASNKNTADVAGSNRKPFRQKGTGRARAGNRRSSLWSGGGVVFGSQKRVFSYEIPKKVKRKAFFSLLSKRVNEECLCVIKDLEMSEFSTKKIIDIFRPLLAARGGSKVVFVVSSSEKNHRFVKKSSDNISWLQLTNVESLEFKDLFYADHLVFSESSITAINSRYLEH